MRRARQRLLRGVACLALVFVGTGAPAPLLAADSAPEETPLKRAINDVRASIQRLNVQFAEEQAKAQQVLDAREASQTDGLPPLKLPAEIPTRRQRDEAARKLRTFSERSAAIRELAVIAESSNDPDAKANAIENLKKELAKLDAEASESQATAAQAAAAAVDTGIPAAPAAPSPTAAQQLDAAIDEALKVLEAQDEEASAAAIPSEETIRGRRGVTLLTGNHLEYGLSVSLVRFQTSRRPDEPARLRNYSPELRVLPSEFGFQFLYHPNNAPWRLRRVAQDGDNGGIAGPDGFQLLSAGGVLLVDVDAERFDRGGLALAGMLGLFEDTLGLGFGFDLYRGIPVQGPDGESGGSTVPTGLLAWAFAREGEITPENAFVVLTINLASIANRLQGQVQ